LQVLLRLGFESAVICNPVSMRRNLLLSLSLDAFAAALEKA